jgi:hypothetical protein
MDKISASLLKRAASLNFISMDRDVSLRCSSISCTACFAAAVSPGLEKRTVSIGRKEETAIMFFNLSRTCCSELSLCLGRSKTSIVSVSSGVAELDLSVASMDFGYDLNIDGCGGGGAAAGSMETEPRREI